MVRLTRAQVREIDRRAIEQYGIPGIVLMENAARAVSNAAVDALGDCVGEVLIVCGGGNNGGDGLAVARHLHNCGADVTLLLTVDPQTYRGDASINWQIVQAMQLEHERAQPRRILESAAVLIVDAIFGTGLTRPAEDPEAGLIEAINASPIATLSVDLPSGLDCDTGRPLGACVRAERTVTFVAEKAGFANAGSREFTGEITVGDIGVPRELIERVRREVP